MLSDREKRMQKTYNELFKLQNLLEKTVRSVEVKNNLKSIGSADTTPSKHSEGMGGRPYYPGSPVRGSPAWCAFHSPSIVTKAFSADCRLRRRCTAALPHSKQSFIRCVT